LDFNTVKELNEQYDEIISFQNTEITRIRQNLIDTGAIVYNASNSILEQSKGLREIVNDKVSDYLTNFQKYQANYVYSPIANTHDILIYAIEENKAIRVSYDNEYIIPACSRWLDIAGNKLLLTGGEKDCYESLNTVFVFTFKRSTNAVKVDIERKADMLTKRRSHSMIYLNDYVYTVSGLSGLDMVKKCEKYDVFRNRWIEIPKLNYPRLNASLAVYNQRYLYCFGGYEGFKNQDTFERLDVIQEDSRFIC
jgi:hypothetical protein